MSGLVKRAYEALMRRFAIKIKFVICIKRK